MQQFTRSFVRGKTGFVGWSGPAGGDWDALIGEGRVRAYINCYTANSGYTNVARRFRAAIEKGELTYEDYSQDVLMLQLHAASLGLPYLPVRMMQGSGLVKFWGISEEKRRTMEGVDNLKCVEIENPLEPGEKLLAVPVPKLFWSSFFALYHHFLLCMYLIRNTSSNQSCR